MKKGRGRPRKMEAQPVQPAEVKKGRGRPRKVETQPAPAVEKKKAGRPKKITAPALAYQEVGL